MNFNLICSWKGFVRRCLPNLWFLSSFSSKLHYLSGSFGSHPLSRIDNKSRRWLRNNSHYAKKYSKKYWCWWNVFLCFETYVISSKWNTFCSSTNYIFFNFSFDESWLFNVKLIKKCSDAIAEDWKILKKILKLNLRSFK